MQLSIESIILNIYNLPKKSLGLFLPKLIQMECKKNTTLINSHKIEPYIYFIQSGVVRAYFEKDNGDEITFWFGMEGDTIISMKSYIENIKGYETIELLEDCILYRIHKNELIQLYMQDIHLSNWGRKFAETELIKTEERLITRNLLSAKQRYHKLLEHEPKLLQRVNLGHVASYLGITQVSLSRIRGEQA